MPPLDRELMLHAPQVDGVLMAVADGGPLSSPADHPATLTGLLQRAARDHPRHGVVYLDEAGTAGQQLYPELLASAATILAGLRTLDLAPGAPVLFQLPAAGDFIPAFWGCTLGGFVPVPASIAPTYEQPHSMLDRLINAWRLLDAPVILTDAAIAPRLRAYAATLDLPGIRVVAIEPMRAHAPATGWHQPDPEDLALLLLTSGSTGMPKAVRQTHANLVNWAIGAIETCALTDADISLNWMPLDHVGGLVMSHIRDVFTGARQLHIATEAILRRPLTWLDLIDRHRATITWAPNFAYALVNDNAGEIAAAHWDLSCMRIMINGGEAVVARTARRFLDLLAPHGLPPTALHPTWGMSETCSGSIYSTRFTRETTTDDDPFVPVGQPVPGLSLRIVDDQDRLVAQGRVGRLQATGLCVTRGYQNNPEATAASFTAGGWFVTGDLGIIDASGLTLVGREKDVIIINGANFYSHEIESIVEEIDGVAVSFTAACGVRPPGAGAERLAIFFCAVPSAAIPLPQLIRSIRRAVTQRAGIAPDVILPLPAGDIPKTAIGKIQRAQLKDRYERGDFAERLASLTAPPAPVLFHRTWHESPVQPAPLPPASRILVFAPPGGTAIPQALRSAGHDPVTVTPGAGFDANGPNAFTIDPVSPAGYTSLRDALANQPVTHIVHAWTYPPSPAIAGAAQIESAQPLGCLSLLHLLQAWPQTATRLLVVSSRTQSGSPEFAKSPLLGLLRTIPEEYDSLRVSHLDFDHPDPATDPGTILAELADPGTGEARICGGLRQTSSIAPTEAQAGPALDGSGFVVLAGGFGGIGRVIAAHLSTRILLLGRTKHPGTPENPQIRHAIGDVTDPVFVREAVAAAAAHWDSTPQAVINLTGAYHETPIAKETTAGLMDILRPKLAGAWALHALAAGYPACRFVHFSSLIGQFGAYANGAYAAASAGIDAFARYQRAAGIDSRSIAWSLWAGTGMARGVNHDAQIARGYIPLPPARALALLEQALHSASPVLLAGLDASNRSIQRHLDAAHAVAQATAAVAPRTATESFLAGIWQDIIGIPAVGVHDNFFDIGGRSLLAARMFARIDKERGRKLPLSTLYQAPTIAELATILETGAPAEGMEIHAIQPNGALPPFFCIPGVGSDVIVLQELAAALGDARPFYGLQAHGLDGTPAEKPLTSIEDIAAGFIAAIRIVQPGGPYHIGGHCFGSLLAWEVARQLRAQRQDVALLALIDPVVSSILPAELIQRDRLLYTMLKFLRLPLAQKARYVLEKLKNTRRYMLVRERLGQSIEQARTLHTGYRIDSYPGDVTVFMADESFHNATQDRDPRRYYERFAKNTRYIPAPGNHDSMLQAPNVETLARSLRASLTAAGT